MIVLLAVVKLAMHTGIQADNHTLKLIRLDTDFFAGCFKVFRADQTPAFNLYGKANSISGVCVNGHFVGVTGSFTVKLSFHNVTGSIAMRAGMHGTGDFLSQDATLGHGVIIIDYRLIKIRPAGNFCAERVCQVDEYFLAHGVILLLLK
jgi:hypothetical protein